jgi:stage II sporulation protein AA (anti-sigma F factor antagonist)
MTEGSERFAGGCEPGLRVVPRPNLLQVRVAESQPGVLVLFPVGEVDVASAGVLRDAARHAVATRPRCLVVDLGGLTFCGSTGLVVLMDACRDAEEAGVRFGTADGAPIVRRVLEITQLGPTLHHRDTVAEVVSDLDY